MNSKWPWKIISSKNIYKNPWIQLTEEEVENDKWEKRLYWIINMVDWVSVLAMDKNQNVYLTEEFRYALEEDSIELVSWWIDSGEDAILCAQRELKEELWITAKKWIDLWETNPFTWIIKSNSKLFLATDLIFGDALEEMKMIKLTLEEAKDMVINSKITHSPSCVLIMKAYFYVNRGVFK